jgi:hypothetical protein
MAITKPISLLNNFNETSVFDKAYIKVENVNCTKTNGKATVLVCKEKDGLVVQTLQVYFVVDLQGNNFISQAYRHLKTLPEYADALDC